MTTMNSGETHEPMRSNDAPAEVQQQRKEISRLKVGLGVSLFFVLFFFIFLVAYASTHKSADNNTGGSGQTEGSSTSSKVCQTQACVSVANEILSSMDQTIDPCVDFFQYACGGFQEAHEYALSSAWAVESFGLLDEYEGNVFLDGLFYPENDNLKTNPAVLKTHLFFNSCLISTSSQEEYEASALFQELVEMVNFTDAKSKSKPWDATSSLKFQEALAWLGSRSWNYLFSLSAVGEQQMFFYQNYEYWLSYTSKNWYYILNTTVAPFYKTLFHLNDSEISSLVSDVLAFANAVYAISTHDESYLDQDIMFGYVRYTTNLSLFGTSPVLNYSNVMLKQFAASNLSWVYYLDPDVTTYHFFPYLIQLIENTSPQTVQFYLFADVIIFGLNFKNYLLDVAYQPRYYSRSDYCVAISKWAFPYVYGYILYQTLYPNEKYQEVSNMVDVVINSGVKVLLNSNTFMDSKSRNATNIKISKLRTFVGFPPPVYDYDKVTEYYSTVAINYNYMDNIGQIASWRAISQQLLFNGETVNMTQSWPIIFNDPGLFGYWLTGINAFYDPSGNYFTIPALITNAPFFSVDYPSSLNFGGIGGIIGHEMSHGYDPNGVLFDGDGNYVPSSIWTTNTKAEYDDRVQCLIDQYDTFEVDNGVFVNGNRTKTENVADNSGNAASWLAWQQWRKTVTDPVLPGLNLTDEQLFFMGWARSWCEITISRYYYGWTDVHAPNKARVWGVVQNSPYFADAFHCAADTPMNPSSKCELWA